MILLTISECINTTNNFLQTIGVDFTRAVKCDGIIGADFTEIFGIKESADLNNALSEYCKEKSRIEQEISNINRDISEVQSSINELNSKISSCDNNNYSWQIRVADREMDEYRRNANRASDAGKREEALGQYRAAQRRKEQAEAERRTNERNRNNYVSQKRAAENTLSECEEKKKNLQKRVEQVREIIRLF